jgi:hypothetical protein
VWANCYEVLHELDAVLDGFVRLRQAKACNGGLGD